MSTRLEDLAQRHSGQRAVILGNGPSLNRTPLELLAGECVWASNRAYLLFEKIDWRPSYYVVVDPQVLANSAPQLSDCMRALPSTLFFFPREARGLISAEQTENICWFQISSSAEQFADGRQYFSIAKSATVAVVSMQLAALLGFTNIVLTGCDMNYRNATATTSAPTPRLFTFAGTADADHFHPDYLGRSATWTIPDVDGMLRDFQRIGHQFEDVGISVCNATVGGNLNCFHRADLVTELRRIP